MTDCPNKHDPIFGDQCCCNCIHRLIDMTHCCTTPDRKDGECHCMNPKGYICFPGETTNGELFAHSGWSEHGLCELHEYKKNYNRNQEQSIKETTVS